LALIVQCRIVKFTESASSENIEDVARHLLEAFFTSLAVRTVTRTSGEKIHAGSQAAGECARALAKLDHSQPGSRGISFDLDINAIRENRWTLYFHGGPFPRLELSGDRDECFCPSPEWARGFCRSGVPDVIWTVDGYLGAADFLYLLLKTQHLSRDSKGLLISGEDARTALRDACHRISLRQFGPQPIEYKPSFWKRRLRIFVRQFDRELIDLAGTPQLSQWLGAMGTNLEQWEEAGR